MKDFIKKNVMLVVVLSIALVVALFLVYEVVSKHSEMKKTFNQIEKIRNEIGNLIKQKPAPLKENLERIVEDSAVFEEKAKDIHKIFGNPYRKALIALAGALGTTEEDLRGKFRKFWKENARRGSNRYQLLIKFKKDCEKDYERKFKRAYEVFADEARKETVEPIDEMNRDDIFLAALGLPRKMSNVNCKRYMISTMQPALVRLLDDKENKEQKNKVVCDKVTKFSFEEFDSKMPLAENIPYILRHWNVIDDLVRRIKKSEIAEFVEITKINGLNGEIDKDYLKFRYVVTIIGPQKNIRGFINELQEAYKDNRVYVVRDIVLEKLVDEIKNLNDEKPQKRSLSTQKRFSLEKKEENVESEEEKEKNIPLKRKKDYAIKILAFNDETRAVKATIEFDYVIYIGDEYRL